MPQFEELMLQIAHFNGLGGLFQVLKQDVRSNSALILIQLSHTVTFLVLGTPTTMKLERGLFYNTLSSWHYFQMFVSCVHLVGLISAHGCIPIDQIKSCPILQVLLPLLLFLAAEHQGESSQSHRALEVTIVTVWRCTPWTIVLRLSTTTCSAGWGRGLMSAPQDAEEEDQETGVSVSKQSRIGSGDLTGTALKARRETCLTWVLGLLSLRWRCGSKSGELWLKSSSLLHHTLTTAGLDIAPAQVPAYPTSLSHKYECCPVTLELGFVGGQASYDLISD